MVKVQIVIDDMGSSLSRDLAGAALIHAHPGTCVGSVMVTSAHATQNASRIADCFEFLDIVPTQEAVGLHLNLTEGPGLCAEAWTLHRPKRRTAMLGKHNFYAAADMGLLLPAHVEGEVRAQLEAFRRAFGFYPRRVDGHQHCHLHPVVVAVLCRLATQYGIRRTRHPPIDALADPACRACYRASKQRHALTFGRAGITAADGLVGLRWCHGKYSLEDLIDEVSRARRRGSQTVEVMTHPSFMTAELNIVTQFLAQLQRGNEL